MEFMNSFHNTIQFTFNWSSEQVNFWMLMLFCVMELSLPIYIASLRTSTSIYFIPRATRILVRRVSLLGRPLGYAVFVPQNAFFEKRARELCNYLVQRTTRTTRKGKSIGLVGSLGRTP